MKQDVIENAATRLERLYLSHGTLVSEFKSDPFMSLVAVILSARTKGDNVNIALSNLIAMDFTTPQKILDASLTLIENCVKATGTYKNKARNIQRMSRQLLEVYNGQVPDTRRELLSLAGVGRKSADVILRFVHEQPVVAVDTHVGRLVRRLLGINSTNDQIADFIEQDLSEPLRWNAHQTFIEYGSTVCKSHKPRCNQCILNDICASHYN